MGLSVLVGQSVFLRSISVIYLWHWLVLRNELQVMLVRQRRCESQSALLLNPVRQPGSGSP